MARNLWSDRPLGVKLAALVAAGAASMGTFALISVQALQGTGETAQELVTTGDATGLALEADMMHDAVRADVLNALISAGTPQYQTAVGDLADHSANFRDLLDQVVAADLSGDVDAAVEKVRPDVESYLTSAEQIIRTAGVDPAAARAAYPGFGQAFSALEESLPSVGDAIGVSAEEAAQHSAEQRSTAITLALIVAAIGVAVLAVLGWVYWPTFRELYDTWTTSPEYSHGLLVPFFALYLLVKRKPAVAAVPRP
jgi:methyl-accepting chemotaxis protein